MVSLPRLRVLLVEDDARLAALVREYLEKNEAEVTVAGDGERGLAEARRHTFDVILLDIMLPGRSGLEVCRDLRARDDNAGVGIIMLTARGDDIDKVVGLEIGADDYVAKPFNPRELLARVRAVARRAGGAPRRAVFRSADLEIDFDAREARVRGERRALTHHEFEVLAVLARAAGRVLSREQILAAVRADDADPFDRSVDVHVSKLRAKLEDDPRSPRYVRTVRGAGYVLSRGP